MPSFNNMDAGYGEPKTVEDRLRNLELEVGSLRAKVHRFEREFADFDFWTTNFRSAVEPILAKAREFMGRNK